MKNFFRFLFCSVMIVVAACSGGGGGGGTPGDTTPPTVSSPAPANGAADVPAGAVVSATFSEAMDPATVTAAQFTLSNGVTGSVAYDAASHVVTFTPDATLSYGTTYTATITKGVKDLAGNALTADYLWSFVTISSAPVWTATDDISAEVDEAYAVAADANSLYIVGVDRNNGATNSEWRIEKRNKSDGALVSSFGAGGAVTSNPSTQYNEPEAIAIDSTDMYVAGYDMSAGPMCTEWRIEKRSLADGSLTAGFGTGGVVTYKPGCYGVAADAIVVDTAYLYAVGYDSSAGTGGAWRIEKRNLSDGGLVNGFGSSGVVTSDPSTGFDAAAAVVIDQNYLYVAGYDNNGNGEWRIEKRSLATGASVTSFGVNGAVTSNPTTSTNDQPVAMAADGTYLYVFGYDRNTAGGNYEWRIEKRSMLDGSLVNTFGTYGVVTSHPSTYDWPKSIVIDAAYLYVTGSTNVSGNGEWRIEKRKLSDGSLVTAFGAGGVIEDNPSAGFDQAYGIAADADYLYICGSDNGPGGSNYEWRIEKRPK